jgi:hypothetical protein
VPAFSREPSRRCRSVAHRTVLARFISAVRPVTSRSSSIAECCRVPPHRRPTSTTPNKACSRPPCPGDFSRCPMPNGVLVYTSLLGGRRLSFSVRPPNPFHQHPNKPRLRAEYMPYSPEAPPLVTEKVTLARAIFRTRPVRPVLARNAGRGHRGSAFLAHTPRASSMSCSAQTRRWSQRKCPARWYTREARRV